MASNKGQNLCLVSARRLEIDIIMSYSDVFVILLIIYSVFTFDWYNCVLTILSEEISVFILQ